MSEQFKNYSVNDFDRYDCVRLSRSWFFALAYLLRGYVVWIMSVTNLNDGIGVIQWVYPEPNLFYLNLVSGCVGIFLVFLICLRKPDAGNWVKSIWPYALNILLLALLVDSAIIIGGFVFWQLTTVSALVFQLILAVLAAALCILNKRLKINLQEFPEPLPEK